MRTLRAALDPFQEHHDPTSALDIITTRKRELLENLPRQIEHSLTRIGLQASEIKASWSMVSPTLRAAFPVHLREAVNGAAELSRGVGLCGGIGVGKTFAVSAWIRGCVERRAERMLPWFIERIEAGEDLIAAQMDLAWWCRFVSWPDVVEDFRRWASREPWKTGHLLEELSSVPVLVLDDLGAERMVGRGYAEDFAASQFSELVEARFRRHLGLIFTSNITPHAIPGRYGARVASRLESLAPSIQLPNQPDRRIERAANA